jgi:hypothetical protein
MNVLTIGSISGETKVQILSINSDSWWDTSYSPKRYCVDNTPGGDLSCKEVLQDGQKMITKFTTNAKCETSPGKLVFCI